MTVSQEERREHPLELRTLVGQRLATLSTNPIIAQKEILQSGRLDPSRLTESLVLLEETSKSIRDRTTRPRPSVLDDCGSADMVEWHPAQLWQTIGVSANGGLPVSIKVLVADDHPLILGGLRQLLLQERDI